MQMQGVSIVNNLPRTLLEVQVHKESRRLQEESDIVASHQIYYFLQLQLWGPAPPTQHNPFPFPAHPLPRNRFLSKRESRWQTTGALVLGNAGSPSHVGEGLTADGFFLSPRAWPLGLTFFFSSEYWLERCLPRAPPPGGGGPLGTAPRPTAPRPTTRMIPSHPSAPSGISTSPPNL